MVCAAQLYPSRGGVWRAGVLSPNLRSVGVDGPVSRWCSPLSVPADGRVRCDTLVCMTADHAPAHPAPATVSTSSTDPAATVPTPTDATAPATTAATAPTAPAAATATPTPAPITHNTGALGVDLTFEVTHRYGPKARAGIIHTPHGDIETPAFIPVATKATVKTLTPEQIRSTGAQAILSNAYHLYLQPGPELVDEAGGVATFENWHGPTYTDSGGFQVMSLGVGFKKVLAMETTDLTEADIKARHKDRYAHVDEDGVNFRSVIDGSRHRFTPEKSMQIQHYLGADIMFAFDELTTLIDPRSYQEDSVERTRRWAQRCLEEHNRLTAARPDKPLQSLWGVVQGAQYEDLRRHATRGLLELSAQFKDTHGRGFGGFGIGGALEKHQLGTIVGWVTDELPEDLPRHLLGISEPDDLFVAIEAGADTFDCVAPTRLGRRGGVYTLDGRMNLSNARFTRDFRPIDPEIGGYSNNYTRAYIHHLVKAHEFLAGTLCSLHNIQFITYLVDNAREAIKQGCYAEYKEQFLARYYANGGKAKD